MNTLAPPPLTRLWPRSKPSIIELSWLNGARQKVWLLRVGTHSDAKMFTCFYPYNSVG